MNLTSWRVCSYPLICGGTVVTGSRSHSWSLVKLALEPSIWLRVCAAKKEGVGGREQKWGRPKHEKYTCLSPKECFWINFPRINSVMNDRWASALRGHKFCSRGQLMIDMFSRLNSQRRVKGQFLNLKISDPTEAVLSFQKCSKVAQEDECVTFAHV